MFDFFKKSIDNNSSKSFVEEPNTVVVTTKFVIKENKTITYVSHDLEDNTWQFWSNDSYDDYREIVMLVSLKNVIEKDKSLLEISDLPLGFVATRKDKNDKWKISKQNNN